MWVVRQLLRLALNVSVAVGVALALAAAQAPLRGSAFREGLIVSLYLVGSLLLVMAALGGGSYSRAADALSRGSAWGHVPGLPGWAERREGETTLAGPVVFLLSGLALIVLAIVLS